MTVSEQQPEPDVEEQDQPADGVAAVLAVHAEATVTHPDGSED